MSAYFEAFAERARRFPDAPALIGGGTERPWTYAELYDTTQRFAHAIADTRSDIVPIHAAKSPHSIALSLGCLSAGRAFAWLNRRLRAPQLEAIARETGAELIVSDGMGLMALGSALSSAEGLKSVRWAILRGEEVSGAASNAAARAVERLSEVLSIEPIEPAGAHHGEETIGLGAEDAGCCLFTSGSTGRQKGVAVGDADLLARARSEAEWYGLGEADRLLSVLPFSFDVGLNQLMSALIAGSAVVLHDSWLPADLIQTVRRQAITGISGVPALWRDLLRAGMELETGCDSLRFVTVSGGSLAQDEQLRLTQAVGQAGVFKTYGQTESFRSASLAPGEIADRPTSVGRAYPGTRVFVLAGDGTRCAPGATGEVVHAGDGTMLRYLGGRDPHKLRALPAALGGGRAIYTGDDGYLDRDGYLHLSGRRDSMVKISGNRVYPEEVASALRAMDGLDDAEVVAIEKGPGEAYLVGFVECGDDTDPKALRRRASGHLPSFMVPERFEILGSLPRLANGKPDRRALRDIAEAG